MSAGDYDQRDALVRLGASSAEAIAQVLETWAPGAIERGDVSVIPEAANPFASLSRGSVAASVSYVDGVSGANVFALTPAGARVLASAMGAPPPDPEPGAEGDPPLSELELSAISEISNQMMAASASAIGVVLGHEIEISIPEMHVIDDPAQALERYGRSGHSTSTTFLIGGESCRLIQLVPPSFLVRMARALDELGGETLESSRSASDRDGVTDAGEPLDSGTALEEALGEIKLRVWAELGRTQLPLGRALALPLGSVVELDRTADAPVDLYVNGVRFAQGHLVVTDDGEWAFHCDAVGGRTIGDAPNPQIPTPEPQGAVT